MTKPALTDLELSGLISLKMCYDKDLKNEAEEAALEDLLQRESLSRGYANWIEAMHDSNLGKTE